MPEKDAAKVPYHPFDLTKIWPHKDYPLIENTARSVGGAPREIQLRHTGNCLKADPAYGRGVATALGTPEAEIRA